MSEPTAPDEPETPSTPADEPEEDTDETRRKRGGPSSHDTAGQFPADEVAESGDEPGSSTAPSDQS